ncbi:MAG: hypothetical protein RRY05_09760 [Bacteroidales bacterium]
MKRTTPQILIDRAKFLAYPYDYIFCDDSNVAFIAKVLHITDTAAFNQLAVDDNTTITHRFKIGGCAIMVEKFMYGTPSDYTRVKSLLKKILKKYLYGEAERYFHNKDFDLENQITQARETVRHNKNHYDELLKRAGGNRELADFNIQLAEATLHSLMELQDIKK